MKPVDQTRFGYPGGNCFAACMASVFEIPLEATPDLAEQDWSNDSKWWQLWIDWLAERNCALLLTKPGEGWPHPKGYALAGGKSPRGDFDHSVVVLDGKLVHDPHPSRAGVVGPFTDFTLFYPLDPAKPMRIGGAA